MNRRCAKLVCLRHGAGRSVRGREIAADKGGLLRLTPSLRYRRCYPIFHFRQEIGGEGVAKILHDVKSVTATDHAHPDQVISRVEQVRAMRGRKHEMLMTSFGIEIGSYIFAFLV